MTHSLQMVVVNSMLHLKIEILVLNQTSVRFEE